jgi:hypothetical protein
MKWPVTTVLSSCTWKAGGKLFQDRIIPIKTSVPQNTNLQVQITAIQWPYAAAI